MAMTMHRSGSSSRGSSRSSSSDGFSLGLLLLSSEVLSLTAFGLVSVIVTSLERRKKKQQETTPVAASPEHVAHVPHYRRPFHPPADLVRYLKEKGGKKWHHYNEETEEFVRECPKVELHVHLDGSLDPHFLWHCMKQMEDNGEAWMACLPVSTTLPWDAQRPLHVRHLVQNCKTVNDFHELCTCRRGRRSLQDMLTCFEIFLPLIRASPPIARLVEELAYDFCRRQWEQNVIYTEVRHCPHMMLPANQVSSGSFDMGSGNHNSHNDNDNDMEPELPRKQLAREVLQAITRGLRRGCADYNIIVNQILCAINWRPDWAWDVLELAQEFQHEHPCGVVGIDIAAGEEHFDPIRFPHLHQTHYEMMQQAQALGIPVAIHAGETPNGMHHIRRAMATHMDKDNPGYGAKRIGHGYRMADSVELMKEVANKKIHVEICPTSSVETGGWMFDEALMDETSEHSLLSFREKKKPWKQHPALKMLKYGIPISLNSDDPAVFHTSLAWQYRIALVKMGMTQQQVVQTNIHAIEAAFGRPDEKAKILKELQSFMDDITNGNKVNNGGTQSERFTDRVRDPF